MATGRCLVVGGAGFIGSHLVEALAAAGYPVRVFDQAPRPHDPILTGLRAAEWVQGDFQDRESVAAALQDCEICFHLVSTTLPQTSNENPLYDARSNLLSTIQFLDEVTRAGVRRVIFLSSGGTVYGIPKYLPIDENHPTDPTNSYGIVKLAIEKYLALYRQLGGLDFVVLRLSNPFGERQRIAGAQGVIAVFMGKILRDQPLDIWGDGSVIRDYIYIGDVAQAMVQAVGYQGAERILNIGSGMPLALTEVIDAIEDVTGKHVVRRFLPGRSFDVPISVLSIKRAQTLLGWNPHTPFLEGLARTRDWVLSVIAD